MRAYLKALTKVETKSASGLVTSTFQYSFSFYAYIETQKLNESFSNLVPGARSAVTFSTWLRIDLKRDMRVVYDEEQYNIVAINRGFKTLTIDCERVE
jgi:head-tail adaptor